MYKGSEFQHKPIIAINTGKIVERVKDVLFDAEHNKLLGVQLNSGMFSQKLVVPFEKIKAIGPDAITIDTEDSVTEGESHPDIGRVINRGYSVNGTKVITESGKHLGAISDVLFDEVSGEVRGYELTGGAFADMYTGKSYIAASDTFKIGRDVVIVPDHVESDIKEQMGGIKGSMNKAGMRIQGATESIKGSMNKNGEMSGSPMSEQMQDRVSATGERVKTGTQEFSNALQEGWERLKARTLGIKDMTQSKVEEKRIKDVLGKPVTRVILDQNDNVILKTGDLITHEAVERAREAGVLDMLLSSAYNDNPTFTSDELKMMGREYRHQ
jgi:uncharacterized protein YrrD